MNMNMNNTTTIRQCLKVSSSGTLEGAEWRVFKVVDGGIIRELGPDGAASTYSIEKWLERITPTKENPAAALEDVNDPRVTCPECGWIDKAVKLSDSNWECPDCGNREDLLVADLLTTYQAVRELLAKFQEE